MSIQKASRSGQVDFALGEDDAHPAFGYELVQTLATKGFCVVQGDASQDDLEAALLQVQTLQFSRTHEDIVEGLLGPVGSNRMATLELKTDPAESAGTKLEQLDSQFFTFGAMLDAYCPACIGCKVTTRVAALLLEAGLAQEPAEPLSPDDAMRWLQIFQWHRVMGIFVLGPSPGTLEMRPFDDFSGSHYIQLQPGTWAFVRTDALSHSFVPEGPCWALSTFFQESPSDAPARRANASFPLVPVAEKLDRWLLRAMRAMKDSAETVSELEAMAARDLQRMTSHLYHKGHQIAVRGADCNLPGRSSNMESLRALLYIGGDAAERIPYSRWDNALYFTTEPQDGLSVRDTYTCQHGSFIDGIENFDNKFFGVSIAETRGMDPLQRHCLELCYEVAFSAGHKKATLMRANIGVYTGGPAGVQMEWSQVPKTSVDGALGSTNGSPAILSNRLSYVFGMNGPNFLVDLEGAASLVALSIAVDSLIPQKAQCSAAMALGIDLIMHPIGYWVPSWAGLLSARGRCLSFDQTADGFSRGEGVGGLYLSPLMQEVDGEQVVVEDPPWMGLVSGVFCNNSGKTASLNAPSGAMDQEMLAGALRRAEISRLDVDAVDCHGIGSIFQDAVEVMALCRGYRPEVGNEMLGVGAVKSNFGSPRPASGVVALCKVLLSFCSGVVGPTQHLLRLNPHVLLEDLPVLLCTESVANRMNSTFSGITNRGTGGTQVHAILWGRIDGGGSAAIRARRARSSQRAIVYWPGGGGELDRDAVPSKSYSIIGTFNSWTEAIPMVNEGEGIWSYTLTLGEHAVEKFQIWLDGSPDRVLHPGAPNMGRDVPVCGPERSEDCSFWAWAIDGCAHAAATDAGPGQAAITDGGSEAEVAAQGALARMDHKDRGKPGDQYRVTLHINGQYRLVSWEKTMQEVDAPVGTYFVLASWNDFAFQEMTPGSEPGVYYLEFQLLSQQGEFSIARNKDWHQSIYPAEPFAGADGADVLGPDEQGRGLEWCVDGKPGDVYKLELQRRFIQGAVDLRVSWEKLQNIPLTPSQKNDKAQRRFFIIGSWDQWQLRHRMEWDGQHFTFMVEVPRGGSRSFQILHGSDWGSVLHPNMEDASSRDEAKLQGPDPYSDHLAWKIGKYPEEQGGKFQVQLSLSLGVPAEVAWVRKG